MQKEFLAQLSKKVRKIAFEKSRFSDFFFHEFRFELNIDILAFQTYFKPTITSKVIVRVHHTPLTSIINKNTKQNVFEGEIRSEMNFHRRTGQVFRGLIFPSYFLYIVYYIKRYTLVNSEPAEQKQCVRRVQKPKISILRYFFEQTA